MPCGIRQEKRERQRAERAKRAAVLIPLEQKAPEADGKEEKAPEAAKTAEDEKPKERVERPANAPKVPCFERQSVTRRRLSLILSFTSPSLNFLESVIEVRMDAFELENHKS